MRFQLVSRPGAIFFKQFELEDPWNIILKIKLLTHYDYLDLDLFNVGQKKQQTKSIISGLDTPGETQSALGRGGSIDRVLSNAIRYNRIIFIFDRLPGHWVTFA